MLKPMMKFVHTETGKEIVIPALESYSREDIIKTFVAAGHTREECEAALEAVLADPFRGSRK